ncbi:MAG: phage holin family protein, partial [Gaiellaceae bacterium]
RAGAHRLSCRAMSVNAAEPRGIRASVRRVARHASALMTLQRELARVEMSLKAEALGAGVGLGIGTAVVGVFALAFGLATAVVALSLVLDLWLAFLIVFVVLLLLTALLGLLAVRTLRKGTPLAPEQAIEEARLTQRVLKARG